VCGGARCGKTLLAMEFARARRRLRFDEPGVFIAFEETDAGVENQRLSLGFDLAGLVRRKKM